MHLASQNQQRSLIGALLLLLAVLVFAADGQSSGGNFQVTQSVVASGGDQSSGNGNLVVTGTAGQPGAGTSLSQTPFSQTGGFWPGAATNTPTAAPASISGRVTTSDGLPLAGVVMLLSGATQARAITDSNGQYSFSHAGVGSFYTVAPSRANYSFTPASRSFSLIADKADAVFTALADAVATTNPLDTPEFFVRQQYLDLLGREPDPAGFNYWSNQILACGGDVVCVNARRRAVAAAFFMNAEFQLTGSFIYNLYKGALGRLPAFAEYTADRPQVVGGPDLERERIAFSQFFVQRTEFVQKYQANTNAESFVATLIQNVQQSAGVDLSGRVQTLISAYDSGGSTIDSRAAVMRAVADDAMFKQREYNAAFVLTEYFVYLRRDPDQAGYDFWLNVLNNGDPGNYRGMVCSFITAREYQQRFGPVITHANGECSW